jgi:hypothetical protein
MIARNNEFEKLNERKKHYPIVDDDTIQSLIRYYGLENDSHIDKRAVFKFVKDTGMKGDSFD